MGISTNYEVKLIKMTHLEQDYYQFDFTKPEGFSFEEGQFGVWGFGDTPIEGRRLRAFSIASSNEELFLRVGTKIVEVPSDFKKHMILMKPGDTMTLNAPKGDFLFEKSMNAVFIAGGIGITPIRSMLLSKERLESRRRDLLIYSELASCYPFKEELENLSGLVIKYAADIIPTQDLIRNAIKDNMNEAMYYLSGSPGFVTGIKALLEQNGVLPDHIRHDVFTGY